MAITIRGNGVTDENHPLFSRVEHNRTADGVVHQIETLILDGVLRDGDRLPGERDLAQRLDVSRPILREALKELETRGLLASTHGGGTFVADSVLAKHDENYMPKEVADRLKEKGVWAGQEQTQ